MRLQKFMAECGVGSRRKCEEMIRLGRVYLNGKKVTEMGTLVDPERDEVILDGKHILKMKEKKIYIMLNKPRGIITTVHDPQNRKTVLDCIGWKGNRIYPVGRLDYDTEGLLILTNDGEFAYKMTHPKHQVEKEYYCVVRGYPTKDAVNRLRQGVDIGEFVTSPAEIIYLGKQGENAVFQVIIREGKNRQVRKMFEFIGHPILFLRRNRIGNLSLGRLRPGQWRFLKDNEVNQLIYGGNNNNDSLQKDETGGFGSHI
ncbi:MAG: pseudouridine synthase [Caldicoprobacterales bacterium]|jgi:23S rRNA pseudouridine2605 synthase|nr:rRNA pseudouridine synthase [Clostridiales bacterium]